MVYRYKGRTILQASCFYFDISSCHIVLVSKKDMTFQIEPANVLIFQINLGLEESSNLLTIE